MSSISPVSAFYYLDNFRRALSWVQERYADLLVEDEQAFIQEFHQLGFSSQAFLVRMIMRCGPHFRLSKLTYPEIGDIPAAAGPLLDLGWVTDVAPLTVSEVAKLLRREEILTHLPLLERQRSASKRELLEQLLGQEIPPQPFRSWCPNLHDDLLSLQVGDLCDRLRLMFFGNLNQDWTEFVLADLGIYRYETVPFDSRSRGFQSRRDLEDYLQLRALKGQYEDGAPIAEVLSALLNFKSSNAYLIEHHTKRVFEIAQHLEQCGDTEMALSVYRRSIHRHARWREIRLLEKLGRYAQALELAQTCLQKPNDDEELQRLKRVLPRLRRRLGLVTPPEPRQTTESRIELVLTPPAHDCVEIAVRDCLHQPSAPVFYVENTLFCSLFGLLCWDAIFAPLPGAFFHPFHHGPVDLYSPDFAMRRRELFEVALARLEQPHAVDYLKSRYREKFGIQSPFVSWANLDEQLLELALHCIPVRHLQACFRRILRDVKANRSGMPDLIQFYPDERRYRLIEVKGPGDRLQDNQKRWLTFAGEQGIPVEVAYVKWAET